MSDIFCNKNFGKRIRNLVSRTLNICLPKTVLQHPVVKNHIDPKKLDERQ